MTWRILIWVVILMSCLNLSSLFFDPACSQFTQALTIVITIICSLGAGIYLLIKHWEQICAWFSPKRDPTKLDPDAISICLSSAQEFHYRGAKGMTYEDKYRIIDPKFPIFIEKDRAQQNISFAFGVDIGKENVGIPLSNARLSLELTGRDGLQVTVDKGDGQPAHTWKEHTQNQYYWYAFSRPLNERWVNTWNTLSIMFPGPGDYMLTFKITGDHIPELVQRAVITVLRAS